MRGTVAGVSALGGDLLISRSRDQQGQAGTGPGLRSICAVMVSCESASLWPLYNTCARRTIPTPGTMYSYRRGSLKVPDN